MSDTRWKIHKFGGSSLTDASCFERVARILSERPEPRIGVVVSAMAGTTDDLFRLRARDDQHSHDLQLIGARYSKVSSQLVAENDLNRLLAEWEADAAAIKTLLQTAEQGGATEQRSRDIIAGYGEIWSARLLAAHLAQRLGSERAGTWLDARKFITVRQRELGPSVQWEAARSNWSRLVPADFSGIAVITGFIASDEKGLQTTLGRNGSDFSASIVAALAGADELIIWTDVDGVMSADPNRVPEARVIDSLSYNEAMELAYFGAKVIHPQTLGPAVENDIPVYIRNTFAPGLPGSHIRSKAGSAERIKGITAIAGMALINLEGSGMIGVPGTADRLFAALKNADVSVTLISQASSEHSICVAVPDNRAELAHRVVSDAFADELGNRQIQKIDVTRAQSIIAVVGDSMAGTPGIAANFFGTLGRAGINIRAIAQGSSERNISAVVNTADATRALRAVHSGFYLSAKTVSIGLIGPGTVGATLLEQLHSQGDRLRDEFNLDLRIRAIARSGVMLLGDRRIALGDWRTAMEESPVAMDFERFEKHINADHLPHAAIIDCTASRDVARRYAGWLRRGIHVITPNKKAFSDESSYYSEIREIARSGNAHCFYETTVGAALPIIRTIRDLIDTGDRVRSIQGIFSGTLAYLFNVFDGSVPFSTIVRAAKESGYTEPDPRDDLSGMDVARKLTIVAREMGLTLGIGDFPVQNLVPEALRDVALPEFLDRLPEYDGLMDSLVREVQSRNGRLRYLARLTAEGSASVGLEAVDASNSFANINLTDNIVQFVTDRYATNPLVVQGPGAGPAVTAGGVFADLLRLATYLGTDIRV